MESINYTERIEQLQEMLETKTPSEVEHELGLDKNPWIYDIELDDLEEL
jgi:hypothetical protein